MINFHNFVSLKTWPACFDFSTVFGVWFECLELTKLLSPAFPADSVQPSVGCFPTSLRHLDFLKTNEDPNLPGRSESSKKISFFLKTAPNKYIYIYYISGRKRGVLPNDNNCEWLTWVVQHMEKTPLLQEPATSQPISSTSKPCALDRTRWVLGINSCKVTRFP